MKLLVQIKYRVQSSLYDICLSTYKSVFQILIQMGIH